jgi:hypothetical protein
MDATAAWAFRAPAHSAAAQGGEEETEREDARTPENGAAVRFGAALAGDPPALGEATGLLVRLAACPIGWSATIEGASDGCNCGGGGGGLGGGGGGRSCFNCTAGICRQLRKTEASRKRVALRYFS